MYKSLFDAEIWKSILIIYFPSYSDLISCEIILTLHPTLNSLIKLQVKFIRPIPAPEKAAIVFSKPSLIYSPSKN